MSQQIYGPGGITLGDAITTFIRKDANTFVESGVIIYFMDAGTNFRVKDGKGQVRNDTTLAWHSIGCRDVNGVPTLYCFDTGES
jgi:hypothetical protein